MIIRYNTWHHVLLDHAKDWYGRRKIHFHHQFAQHFQSKTGVVCIFDIREDIIHVKCESPKHKYSNFFIECYM